MGGRRPLGGGGRRLVGWSRVDTTAGIDRSTAYSSSASVRCFLNRIGATGLVDPLCSSLDDTLSSSLLATGANGGSSSISLSLKFVSLSRGTNNTLIIYHVYRTPAALRILVLLNLVWIHSTKLFSIALLPNYSFKKNQNQLFFVKEIELFDEKLTSGLDLSIRRRRFWLKFSCRRSSVVHGYRFAASFPPPVQ